MKEIGKPGSNGMREISRGEDFQKEALLVVDAVKRSHKQRMDKSTGLVSEGVG